nr:bestrophin [Candidatus Pantoea persica]
MSLLALALLNGYETLGIRHPASGIRHPASGIRQTLAPFGLLGVSIAIFLGFRNSVCFARFSEARY